MTHEHAAEEQGWRRALARWAVTLGVAFAAAGCGLFQLGGDQPPCDLHTHEGCGATEACVSVGVPRCAPAGKGALGAACVTELDCDRATYCDGPPDERHCALRCRLSAPACGDAAATCQAPGGSPNSHDFGVCLGLACNPFDGSGCPSGERCVPGATPHCSAVIGVAGPGGACTTPESCKTGQVCLTKASAKECVELCETATATSAPPCPEGHECQPLIDSWGQALVGGQGHCVRKFCNALTNVGCPAGEKCYAAAKPLCSFAGNHQLGETCALPTDCGLGLMCIEGADGQRTCRALCDSSGALATYACPSGQLCAAVVLKDGATPPDHVGFCKTAAP